MKTLLILRHGKSDWGAEYEEDFSRPIARRGRKASLAVGRFLKRVDQIPEVVLSSSATRARQTAELAMAGGDWQCPLTCTWELYAATVASTTKIIQSQDDGIGLLMLVGHEPTWSELIASLTGGSLRFPTAALARVDFDTDTWRDIQEGSGTLTWFVTPKLLQQSGLGRKAG